MAQLNNTISLAPGARIKLTNKGSITGAGTLLFTVPPHPGRKPFSALFEAVGTVTGLASALQADVTGTGANLVNYVTSLVTAAAPLAPVRASGTSPLVGGVLYAINVTALSGGPADIWVSLN